MAMREEMVEWTQVPAAPERPVDAAVRACLVPGRSKEEIQETTERHQNGGTATSAAAPVPIAVQPVQPQLTAAAPMMMTAVSPFQMMQRRARYLAYVRALWTVSSLVGAGSILTFL
ncbi:hypothetical protein V7S43_005895 [Phytophthora oleae]|uniref:Uncharacterized protein n=1 Tax=Phytophthora oleae TaxID=2107226 RepID=A0ABD3FST8_9STRA